MWIRLYIFEQKCQLRKRALPSIYWPNARVINYMKISWKGMLKMIPLIGLRQGFKARLKLRRQGSHRNKTLVSKESVLPTPD